MTYPEDLARVCGDSLGGLDVCMRDPGHEGNHVGADATWAPRLQRAVLLAREADKQLAEIREQQDSGDAEKDADHPRRREKK